MKIRNFYKSLLQTLTNCQAADIKNNDIFPLFFRYN